MYARWGFGHLRGILEAPRGMTREQMIKHGVTTYLLTENEESQKKVNSIPTKAHGSRSNQGFGSGNCISSYKRAPLERLANACNLVPKTTKHQRHPVPAGMQGALFDGKDPIMFDIPVCSRWQIRILDGRFTSRRASVVEVEHINLCVFEPS